jgi:hypothetical protein
MDVRARKESFFMGLIRTAVQLPSEHLVMVLCGRAEVLRAGQLIGQIGGLMDQDRQALWADIDFVPLELDDQQRFFLFVCIAVQTDSHEWSP